PGIRTGGPAARPDSKNPRGQLPRRLVCRAAGHAVGQDKGGRGTGLHNRANAGRCVGAGYQTGRLAMRRFWLWSALLLCVHSAQAQQAVPDAVMERAWRPPVILAGNGDPQVAVARMYEYAALRDLLVHHIEYDPGTRDFLDQLRASLERFDLRGFHRLLPENEADNERALLLHNVAYPDHYYVGPPCTQPVPGLSG